MKKLQLKRSWVIRASRNEIYKVISDFENMPKYFPKVAESLRVVKRDGNKLTIKAKAKTFGRVIDVDMQTELRPPVGYVSDNRSDIGTSGHEKFLMEEIPEGTRINYSYDVEIKSWFFRVFAKPLIAWYAMRFWERAVIDKLKEMFEK